MSDRLAYLGVTRVVKTGTFPGERYRRIARRGSKRANVATGRSILIITWYLLSDPEARFQDLGQEQAPDLGRQPGPPCRPRR